MASRSQLVKKKALMTSQVHCVTSISGDWMCDISKMIRIDTFAHNIGTVWSIDPLQLVSGLPGSSVFVLRRVISHIFKKVSYHLFCSLSGWEENSPTCLAGFSPRRCMSLNLKCRSQSFNRCWISSACFMSSHWACCLALEEYLHWALLQKRFCGTSLYSFFLPPDFYYMACFS